MKPPTYYEYKKTKKGIDTVISTISVSHACSHKFILNLKKRVIVKYANSYYIDYAEFDNGKKNIYYTYNRGMKLKTLIYKISVLINKLDMQKKFEPE